MSSTAPRSLARGRACQSTVVLARRDCCRQGRLSLLAWTVLAWSAFTLQAQSPNIPAGTTVLAPLTGQAATNQAELLAKIRQVPRQVPSDARTFTERTGKDSIAYRLFKPSPFDGTNRYPLVLSLHGGGPRKNFSDLLEPFAPGFAYGIGRLASSEEQAKHPSFIVVPWSNGRGWNDTNLRLVVGLLNALRAEFRIDPKRIYVTGQSMGGSGTWEILGRNPDLFAAAIPICGWGEPEIAAKIRHIPVWAFHGTADAIMPISGTRDMVKELVRSGGKPIYWEYAGAGHAQTAERAYCEPLLLDWLFAQVKP
jgi:predicted peptidase